MSNLVQTQKYVSLEDFYEQHSQSGVELLGSRAGQYAWSLKDANPKHEDTERACKIVQKAVEAAVGDKKADWVILTSESHEILSLEAWIDDIVSKTHEEALSQDTGYSDLDLNIETQMVCGRQLESFHHGDWAKEKLLQIFKEENFFEEEPIVCSFKMPLPHLIDKMDRDLEIVTKCGMRHHYKCSVGVSALYLRIAADENQPERLIPVLRRMSTNNIASMINVMKEELDERFKGLVETIKEKQEILRMLPEGWPNDVVSEKMKLWSEKRFLGDNGLVGSDFFDGKWLISDLPSDVHRQYVDMDISRGVEAPSFDLAARVLQRRALQENESVKKIKPSRV